MKEKLLESFFKSQNIEYYSALPLSECKLLYPRKLPEFTKSVCFFLVPYYVKERGEKNISLYACPRDYHLYVKELEQLLTDFLGEKDENFPFRVFADNSPFCERSGACTAGLGEIGKNGLLINPEYGSFVFIGSICLPFPISITHIPGNFNGDLCVNCEKCLSACPFVSGKSPECLSNLNQKKKLSESEKALVSKYPVKWGCDICQDVCPYNKGIKETPIDFFKVSRIPYLTGEILEKMSEEEFSERAYSWRGRAVIERNLGL